MHEGREMIGVIIAWVFIGLVTIGLGVLTFAPFVLSGKISEQEEKHGL
jgi:hypothetical protein